MKMIKVAEKEIAVRPTALTPFLFKRMTNKDLLKALTDKKTEQVDKLDLIIQLFYIMAMQATTMDVTQQFAKAEDKEEFYKFLDSISSGVSFNQEFMTEVISVYTQNAKTTSESKN